jgi:predicted SnoaL-like aldol condensation-catalyzing enzyme
LLTSCGAEISSQLHPTIVPSSAEERNKALVLEYFQEVLDGKQFHRMPNIFTSDIVMHRPDAVWSSLYVIQPMFEMALTPHSMKTTIHEVVASGDYVAVRLTHTMTYAADHAFMQSRLGAQNVAGKRITWDAMAMFRIQEGKIAEEWVSDDELGKLIQIGTLEFAATK